MGLGESVVLAQVRYLLWVFLVLDFLHDGEPMGHFFAIALLYSGEVGFPGRILGHGTRIVTTLSIARNRVAI